MQQFTKVQSIVLVSVIMTTLFLALAFFDVVDSHRTHREVTTFTQIMLGLVFAEHLALLGGAFLTYNYATELNDLRRASAENIGLKTKMMFQDQTINGLRITVNNLEGKAEPVTSSKRLQLKQKTSGDAITQKVVMSS